MSNELQQPHHQRVPKRTIVLSAVLFFLIIGGMFVFAFIYKQAAVEEAIVDIPASEDIQAETPYSDIKRITAKHFYIDGVHTLVGEISMPTPCDLLDTKTTVTKANLEQVNINFSVVNNSQACAQVITQARFKAEAEAGGEVMFHAHFQGRDVELNIIPAAAGETPDDFELFIKG